MKLIVKKALRSMATRMFTGSASAIATLGLSASQLQALEAAAVVLGGLVADVIVRSLLGGEE